MHILDELVGIPGQEDIVKHIRAMTDAALFFDDKVMLADALSNLALIEGALYSLQYRTLLAVSDSVDCEGSDKVESAASDWDYLEESITHFAPIQQALGVARFKVRTALGALDSESDFDSEIDSEPDELSDDDQQAVVG